MGGLSFSDTLAVASIIIGIIVSYYFYLKSIRSKELVYFFRHNQLLQSSRSKIAGLDILYKGTKIRDLAVTRVVMWNRGADTIHGEDIAKKDVLRLVALNDSTILDVEVVGRSASANNFTYSLLPDRKSALLDFDFLDQSQGAVLQVVHTATKSGDIAIRGTIIGGKPHRNIYSPIENDLEDLQQKPKREVPAGFTSGFMLFWGILTFLPGTLITYVILRDPSSLDKFARNSEQGYWWSIIMMIFMGPGFLLFSILAFYSAYRIWQNRPPRGLKAINR